MKKIKVNIEQLSKVYENGDGIRDINLKIYEGEILTLLGPSGCGKSTILRSLGGFNEINSGKIWIDGKNVTGLPPEKRPTSMVFQSYNLWSHMTVYENLSLGLKLRKFSKAEIRSKIKSMLEMLNLPEVQKKYPAQLSGGQQQRVAIGRSLLLEPAVLLLDEPYSALDAKIRMQMREELKRIQRETHVTVVFVTHDQEEALSLSDRIVVMEKGSIAQIGTPSEIYDTPENRYTASFIGEMNFFKYNDYELAVRPEDIAVHAHLEGDHKAVVRQMMNVGHYTIVFLAYQERMVKVYLPKEEAKRYHENQSVSFSFKKTQKYEGEAVK